MNELEILQKKVTALEAILNQLVFTDRYIFQNDIELFDSRDIHIGRGTGTRIGTATDQLIGYWGTTPVDQPASIANVTVTGSDTDSVARTAINAILAALREPGSIAT